MPPDTTDEERQEQLPEDNQTPFTPADPPRDPDTEPDSDRQLQEDALPVDHPAFDSGSDIDAQEKYDAGVASAADVAEPNAGNSVVGYTPPRPDDTADQPTDGQTADDPQSDEADMPSQPS